MTRRRHHRHRRPGPRRLPLHSSPSQRRRDADARRRLPLPRDHAAATRRPARTPTPPPRQPRAGHRPRGRAGHRPGAGRHRPGPGRRSPAPVAWTPPDEDAIGVTRRQFLNRGIVAGFVLGLSAFAPPPSPSSGRRARRASAPRSPSARSPTSRTRSARTTASSTTPRAACGSPSTRRRRSTRPRRCTRRPSWPAWRPGVVALYQKCPHLGCRVPECPTSQWFECGCHGSQYNRVGEKKAGPAPRGLDRFAMSVTGGIVHRRHRA